MPLPDADHLTVGEHGPTLDLDFAPIDPVELGRHVSEPAGRAPSVESQPQAVLRADHAGHAPSPSPSAPFLAHPHLSCGVRRTCRSRGQSDRLHSITLEDFGTVGTGGDPYRSWLPARTEASAPFSRSNPGRTWRP